MLMDGRKHWIRDDFVGVLDRTIPIITFNDDVDDASAGVQRTSDFDSQSSTSNVQQCN